MYKKLLLSVFLVFIALEICLRVIDSRLSIDINHYKKMSTIIASLNETGAKNILFVGNSLTRHGLDNITLNNTLDNTNSASIYPDDTTIIEWSWIIKSKVSTNQNIDTLIISYAGHQLKDKHLEQQHFIRIASIVPPQDLIKVISFEALNLKESLLLGLAHYSRIFSLQERINNRVLDLLPYYRKASQTINQSLKQKSHKSKNNTATYTHLTSIINFCKDHKIQLIVLAIPLPSKYKLDKEITLQHNLGNLKFIDARVIPNLTKDDYLDGYHLNQNGAKKLTIFLTKKLHDT